MRHQNNVTNLERYGQANENDHLKFEINQRNMTLNETNNRFHEIDKLYELAARENMLLKDELVRMRVKYEEEVKDNNVMIRR